MSTSTSGSPRYSHLGYTIDQTILIVAVIAILITLIIASVGWDLLNRTGGTKLASYVRQIEDATGTFYARNGMWPDDALNDDGTGESPDDNVRILQERAVYTLTAGRLFDKHTNLMPGFENDGTNLIHNFGPGGPILMGRVGPMAALDHLSSSVQQGTYFVVEFENVPLTEAQEADEALDGQADLLDGTAVPAGRVVVLPSSIGSFDCGLPGGAGATVADAAADRTVDVCYIGNLVN